MFSGSINKSRLTGPLLVLGCAVVLFILAWKLGDGPATGGALSSQQQNEMFSSLRDQNNQLKDQIRILTLRDSTNEQAINDLNQSLTSLRLQRSKERQELMLFRNLAKGGDSKTGILIDSFSIADTGANEFELEWLLIQPQGRKHVNGDLSVTIEGSQGDTEADSLIVLDLQPRSLDSDGHTDTDTTKFDFRYFQTFTAVANLPDGFEPLVVKITANPLQPHSPAIKRVISEYPWRVASERVAVDVRDASDEDLN